MLSAPLARLRRIVLSDKVEEFTKFLKSSKGHVQAVCTGMRRGEILGLRWQDIDFDHRELKVIHTSNWTRSGLVIQRPKTMTPFDRVKLFQAILDDLQERYEQVQALKDEYGDAYKDNDLVCCYPTGGISNRK
ncbi:tyrosine-type recombinase/integrase [Paenibacillus rhizolycopersici]|uniref:tyrosine-type recombinase/integrase n=1 Tax=Paenibacillus rhizolycopersici TaxID=2780073 RepID=UPI003D26F2E3